MSLAPARAQRKSLLCSGQGLLRLLELEVGEAAVGEEHGPDVGLLSLPRQRLHVQLRRQHVVSSLHRSVCVLF